jgi:myosin-5
VRCFNCFQPNAAKSPHAFTMALVASQLRCAGVISAVRIALSAYPSRVPHDR